MDGQWAENFYTLKACTDEVAKMRDQYGDSVLADCYNEQQAWTWRVDLQSWERIR